jgi:hypothetical protein
MHLRRTSFTAVDADSYERSMLYASSRILGGRSQKSGAWMSGMPEKDLPRRKGDVGVCARLWLQEPS